jgi:hypothetical protein
MNKITRLIDSLSDEALRVVFYKLLEEGCKTEVKRLIEDIHYFFPEDV